MLLLVLVAAAVVPNIATKVIAGKPIAAPVPGPPNVGACVTSVPPVDLFTDSGSKYLILPVLQYGTCVANHYGEITAVLQHLPLQKNPSASPLEGPGYELLNRCPSASLEYLGLADPAAGNATDPAAWVPALNANFVFAGPDPRQKAAGQNWGACVLVANPGTNNAAVSFAGPLQNAVASARLPALFGSCSANLSVLSAPESCSDWHTDQILGQADLTTSDSSPAVRLATCRNIALRVTGMPDPTAGGRLQVEVFIDRVNADGSRGASSGPLAKGETVYGTCGIHAAGRARLNDSLIGLGTAPVPLNRPATGTVWSWDRYSSEGPTGRR